MAYIKQTFTVSQILTAVEMNQVEENVERVRKQHIGGTEPTDSIADGVLWLDNSAEPYVWKMRQGSSWLGIGQVYTTFGRFSAFGGLRSHQIFTASNTWSRPDNINRVLVIATGGGGGGGGGNTTLCSGGGGGGGTGVSIINVMSISTIGFTVGAAGAGGTSASDGTVGGTTFVGSFFSAVGGSGGASAGATGGAGGTASGSDFGINGQLGGGGDAAAATSAAGMGGFAFLGSSHGGGGTGRKGTGTGVSGTAGAVWFLEFS